MNMKVKDIVIYRDGGSLDIIMEGGYTYKMPNELNASIADSYELLTAYELLKCLETTTGVPNLETAIARVVKFLGSNGVVADVNKTTTAFVVDSVVEYAGVVVVYTNKGVITISQTISITDEIRTVDVKDVKTFKKIVEALDKHGYANMTKIKAIGFDIFC